MLPLVQCNVMYEIIVCENDKLTLYFYAFFIIQMLSFSLQTVSEFFSVIMLAESGGKRNVTVWRPSVRLSHLSSNFYKAYDACST